MKELNLAEKYKKESLTLLRAKLAYMKLFLANSKRNKKNNNKHKDVVEEIDKLELDIQRIEKVSADQLLKETLRDFRIQTESDLAALKIREKYGPDPRLEADIGYIKSKKASKLLRENDIYTKQKTLTKSDDELALVLIELQDQNIRKVLEKIEELADASLSNEDEKF